MLVSLLCAKKKMSEDSPDRELWNKRTNDLVQKVRASEKQSITTSKFTTTTGNIKRKDASFSFQPLKVDHSKSIKITRTKQNNVKTTRSTSTTKTQTLHSFFAPKMPSNRTTESNDNGININIEQKKSDNAIKRVKYDTESMIKVD